MTTTVRLRIAVALLLGCSAFPTLLTGQPRIPVRPGGASLFQLDLSGTPVGEFPASLELLKGTLEVALRNGVPMLKASSASEFLITLAQSLPADFTLEFDLVPKLGSNPQDLSFEGTPTINQGVASAHVLWHATGYLAVIGGGGDTYETPMPEDLKATLPGVLTHVALEVQGSTLRLYTNGRRLYTLQKQFARGAVVRVFLGAQDGGTEAVYLAGLRITAGVGLGIAASAAGVTGTAGTAGSTIAIAGGGGSSPPIRTPTGAPAATAVNPGSGPGVTAGPLPAGSRRSSASVPATALIANLAATVGPVADGSCVASWCPDWLQANGSCVVSWCPDWQQAAGSCLTSWCPDWRSGMSARRVTWSWTPPPGASMVLATFDQVATDPTTGGTVVTRLSQTPRPLLSGSSIAVVEGTAIRICVAAQSDPADPTKLLGESCLDTQVPVAAGLQQLQGNPLSQVNPTSTLTSPQPQTASNQSGMTGTLSSAATPVVTVGPGATGPLVDWTPVVSPGVYTVQRWKLGDPLCCNNTSPASPPLTTPPWQDSPLSGTGTFVYQVTLTTSAGVFTGQTQFVVSSSGIATQAAPPPPPPPPTPTPTSVVLATGATGTITPLPAPPPAPPAPIAAQAGLPTTSSVGANNTRLAPQNPSFTGTPAWVRVNWAAPANAIRGVVYTVDRYLESNPSCCTAKATGLGTFWWTDEGTQWAGTYVYRITAVYPDGSMGWVDARWARPDPVNPANFRASPGVNASVILQWDPVPNVDWYYLFGPGVPYGSFQIAPTVTHFTVTGLPSGTYTWQVASYYSSPNAPAPVSTAAAVFPKVTFTLP